MEINYYRQDNAQGYDEAWSACQFTSNTDLSQFSVKPLVSINGQPYLWQHHVTYLLAQVKARHAQLKRHTRDTALLDQIHRLHLLDKEGEEGKEGKPSPLCHGSAVAISKLSHSVNNSLTLPTHPQPVAPCPAGGGTAAVIPSANNNTPFCK